MVKRAPDIMSAHFFAQKVTLHKKKNKRGLRGSKLHPLREIYNHLTEYHCKPKTLLQHRHRLLDTIVRLGNNYIRGKNPSKSATERVQAVAILAWQCNRRLEIEKARAKQFAQQINTAPQHGVGVHHGLRFERIAKPGQLNVKGDFLETAAREGKLGQIEMTGNDEHDFYAMKKLLKTMTPEDLRLAGLKSLEYSSVTQRAQYLVDIDDDELRWSQTGLPVDTLDHHSGEVPGFAHYAMSLQGELYVRKVSMKEMGRFGHSSFLAGEHVLCAGTIVVEQGRLIEITNESGHYMPKARDLAAACQAILDEGYDPADDGYALLTDYAYELLPPGPNGRYRVPLSKFAQHRGAPPGHADYDVLRGRDGLSTYSSPLAAQAAGCTWQLVTDRYEHNPAGCLSPDRDDRCAGPRFHAHRALNVHVCDYCQNYAQISRVKSNEAQRVRNIRQLSQSIRAMQQKHDSIADMACQTIVDLLWECGIDDRPPSRFAFLVCGSIARNESSTFSDIDAVLVLGDPNDRVTAWFADVIARMERLIRMSGLKATGFQLCPGGLSPHPSNGPGLIGTADQIFDIINDEFARYPTQSDHLLGAYHTKLIFGDRQLATEYQTACRTKIDTNRKHVRAQALRDIGKFADMMRPGEEWEIPTGNELFVQIKNQLYRPAHMIIHSLAQYYNVGGVGAREQLRNLVENERMHFTVANMLKEILDVAGQLRMETHLRHGQEFELMRLRQAQGADSDSDRQYAAMVPLAPANQVSRIRAVIPSLKILAGLAKTFVERKAKKGFRDRKNPFMSDKPGSYRL